MNSPILGGIFLAFIPENDTLEEYVKVRRKASYIRKKPYHFFLKKTVPQQRENENDKYYDYKRSSGYATLSKKMLNRHGLIAGATGTGKTVTLKVITEKLSQQRDSGVSSRYQGRSFRSC